MCARHSASDPLLTCHCAHGMAWCIIHRSPTHSLMHDRSHATLPTQTDRSGQRVQQGIPRQESESERVELDALQYACLH